MTSGNLLSDFGVGPWRAANEKFVDGFELVFALEEVRIGSILPGESGLDGVQGAVFRLLRAYPDEVYSLYLMTGRDAKFVDEFAERPTYAQLEKILEDSKGKLRTSFYINEENREADEAAAAAGGEQLEGGAQEAAGAQEKGPGLGAEVVNLQALDVDSLEKTELRAYLKALGVPTAGKVAVLRGRLREAIDKRLSEE